MSNKTIINLIVICIVIFTVRGVIEVSLLDDAINKFNAISFTDDVPLETFNRIHRFMNFLTIAASFSIALAVAVNWPWHKK